MYGYYMGFIGESIRKFLGGRREICNMGLDKILLG